LQARFAALAVVSVLCAASFAPARSTTLVPSQTFKAGTRIACVLEKEVDSATAKYGDEFKLRVVDTSYPALVGAKIHGYISEVTQPSGINKAKITFFLTSIHLTNGTHKQISAFVVNKRVVQYNPGAVQASRQQMLTPPMPNGVVTPGPIAWQMKFGGGGSSPSISTRPSGPLGGTVYALNTHEPIVARAGTSVTVELQQNLTIP
jgi:hypothetical protein